MRGPSCPAGPTNHLCGKNGGKGRILRGLDDKCAPDGLTDGTPNSKFGLFTQRCADATTVGTIACWQPGVEEHLWQFTKVRPAD